MSFHKSSLGKFGEGIPCDRDGYVPEEGDEFSDFDFGGYLEEDDWEEFLEDAIFCTNEALSDLEDWRNEG